MVKAKDIVFSYPALSFQFPLIDCHAGETLLITGTSGKGKTTLLHLLGGLLKPQSGAIIIGGEDITRLTAAKLDQFRGKHIGIVFQQSHFIASLSVLENLLFFSRLSGRKRQRVKAIELLTQLGLAGQMHENPARLSQGQQQRASIARAIINQPGLLLADEPTSSLDDDNCYTVAAMLRNLADETKAALIIVTHDMRLAPFFNRSIQLV